MTLNEISRKLIKNEKKQYALYFFSILFAVTMVGAYGVLQYSPTVTNVLVDGGSTQSISQGMFFGSILGIVVFLIYANSLFLKHKSRETGIFLSLGIDRRSVQKIIIKEFTILFQIAAIGGLLLCVPLAYLSWSLLNLFLGTQETTFAIGWSGLVIALVTFVSSIMVVGLKLVSTIWDDAIVYASLQKLGMKKRKIRDLITRQMVFIYFIPTILGCLIGAFTTYRIMLVSSVIYIAKTMQLVGCVCSLVVVLQFAIFFALRSKVLKNLNRGGGE